MAAAVQKFEPMRFTKWQRIIMREQFGIPSSQISSWARGISRPGAKYLKKVRQATGLPDRKILGAYARRTKVIKKEE